jgi:hypothetical protein
MKKIFWCLLAALPIFMTGCGDTPNSSLYTYCIPDTPDALAAYRQCMLVAHSENLVPCLDGIPDVNVTGPIVDPGVWGTPEQRERYKAEYKVAKNLHPLCREIVWYNFQDCDYFIQACKSETP